MFFLQIIKKYVYTIDIHNDISILESVMSVKTANVIARVEPEIKVQAEEILNKLGIPVSVVINALYHQIIYTNGIPFFIGLPKSVNADLMSEKEFNDRLIIADKEIENNECVPLSKLTEEIIKDK